MRHVNDLGPLKFKTDAKNDKEEICYYNSNKKDSFYHLLAVRKQTSTDAIIFSIISLIDESNKYKDFILKSVTN